jgi:hypothetical protein
VHGRVRAKFGGWAYSTVQYSTVLVWGFVWKVVRHVCER